MEKCTKCNTELEMYYKEYCPKCDIQSMIYEETLRPVIYFPVKDYGLKFVDGFTEEVADVLWDNICETLHSNDSYMTLRLNNTYEHNMFKLVLDELKIDYSKNELFLWISW